MDDQGVVLSAVPDYLAYLHQKSIADNPRLVADTHVGKDHWIINPAYRTGSQD